LLSVLFACGCYFFNDGLDMQINPIILESDSGYSTGPKHRLAMSIVLYCLRIFMYPTVNFNNDLGLLAIKIRNEAFDYLLASKFESTAFPVSQMFPKKGFRRRHVLTQFPRIIQLLLGNPLDAYHSTCHIKPPMFTAAF
jgi:hypothetical protein